MGGIEKRKEECRDVRRVRWLQDLAQDLRFGLRVLRKSPPFTAIAIATLAIGIGANGAIFAVIENVLLKPLPFPDSAQLVDLGHDVPGIGLHGRSAPFLYFTYADQSRSFQSVGLWRENSNNLTGLAEPEHVRNLELTSEVLPMVGMQPLLGRLFSAADTAPGAPLTAMLAYGFWRDKFGADASMIGRNIIIDGRPRQVHRRAASEFLVHGLQGCRVIAVAVRPQQDLPWAISVFRNRAAQTWRAAGAIIASPA